MTTVTIEELAAKVAALEAENEALTSRLANMPPGPPPVVAPPPTSPKCRCGDTSHTTANCPLCPAGHGQRGCVFAAPTEMTCGECGARGGPDPRKLGPMVFQGPPQRQPAVARDTGGSCLPTCGTEGHDPRCPRVNPTEPGARINWQIGGKR